MFKTLLTLFAASALAAPLCAQQGEAPLDPACPQGDLNTPREPGSVCIGRLTDDYAFSVVIPARAAAVPRLDALLRNKALRAEVRFEAMIEERRAPEEPASGRMSYEQGWHVDAWLPELVALSSRAATYLGGAHGGMEYRQLLFDRRRNRQIELRDIFTIGAFEHDLIGGRPVGEGAVQRAFCRALRAEVRERRDDPAASVDCPEALALPIALICSPGGRIESLRALVAPYVVGPWAEGPYEVDIPVDARMMAAVRRRFRPAFAVPGEDRPRRLPEACN